jgi:molybdopterin-synthase adenylyltransferase
MDRYSRQLLYKNIGKNGQEKLKHSHVFIIGTGALGTVCSELLVRAGIGKTTLIDKDRIELSNLQRQFLFDESDVGKYKAKTSKEKLTKINSNVKIEAYSKILTSENISSIIKKPDIVLGCTDNLISRFLLNDYCKKHNIHFVSGMVAGDKGYIFNILPGKPCFSCIYSKESCFNCNSIGIINSASAIIGSIMAKEAIKILLGKKPEQNLLHVDIWNNTITKIKVKKNKTCKACKGQYIYLDKKKI